MPTSPVMQYDPRMVYVAIRSFLFNGVQIAPGDELPTVGDDAPSPARVEAMIRTRFVRPDRIRSAVPKPSSSASTPAKKSSANVPDTRPSAMPWKEVLVRCKKLKLSVEGERHEVRKRLRAALVG